VPGGAPPVPGRLARGAADDGDIAGEVGDVRGGSGAVGSEGPVPAPGVDGADGLTGVAPGPPEVSAGNVGLVAGPEGIEAATPGPSWLVALLSDEQPKERPSRAVSASLRMGSLRVTLTKAWHVVPPTYPDCYPGCRREGRNRTPTAS
jgi:hypothetical protein